MLRILVVDDEPTARDIMVKFLNKKENGIQIIGTASDGYEAMDISTYGILRHGTDCATFC